MSIVPEKPSLDGVDAKFMDKWDDDGIYTFDESSQKEVYSIDTPPPTVSGSLHVGSAFGFAHQDCIARFNRMRGRNVFFPMGWDDNGLPTERRVENFFGIRCDPSLSYDPDFEVPEKPDAKKKVPCSRPNFIEICEKMTLEDEKEFEYLWRRLGLSVDWKHTYTTIGKPAQKTSQAAFIKNIERGEAYQSEAPTAWDVTFQTAVAQAEFEEREIDGTYHTLEFKIGSPSSNETVVIDTTRPELLPACVALIANPKDERYKSIVGKTAYVPLFDEPIPVLTHELCDPEKGTGLVMCCTFGDNNDVIWWRELQLPVKRVMGRNGRLVEDAPESFSSEASEKYSQLAGKTVFSARKEIVEMLQNSGALKGELRPIKHLVKFYEKGDRPLEIVPSQQWYIKNGGRDEDTRNQMLERGKELDWNPDFMKVRYSDWVSGLNGDWLISRQRYFGVPFPIWYPVDSEGNVNREKPIVADFDSLPVDPSVDVPNGFSQDDRNQPGGFVGDPDILDTWATSSLTPQIAGQWLDNPSLFNKVFPMNLRPQGPEIIRTWLFDTVLRSQMEHGVLPWKATYINGWVLDPDRKKMSKSFGNVVTPLEHIEQFGADAFRYWACTASPGTDTAFSIDQIKSGRRLAIKLLNASKLVIGFGDPSASKNLDDVSKAIDKAMLVSVSSRIEKATQEFEKLHFSRAFELVESAFWDFCDNYLELIKQRAYGNHGDELGLSAQIASQKALSLIQRGFAPFIPFVSDEVWSWVNDSSIHSATWPDETELNALPSVDRALDIMELSREIITAVRGAKSVDQVSMRHPVDFVTITDTADNIELIGSFESDLIDAGNIAKLNYEVGSERDIKVQLGEAST